MLSNILDLGFIHMPGSPTSFYSHLLCPTYVFAPFWGHQTSQQPRHGPAKSENTFLVKIQNGRQRFGLTSKIFGQKTKVSQICEPMEKCEIWALCDQK